MADVIITFKLMPTSPDVNLDDIKDKVKEAIAAFGGEVGKEKIEPVAFGLNALILIFVMDEDKGSTEDLEAEIAKIEGVNSVECTDVRRAVG
ncbi:elongation factor 1-beta [Candidatus Woesearchaeota archaeon]|jgi:elongation factor 1-beta|nr:elongation factor 1-beta [Candidatus Woesearchaeota archaeon]